MLVTLGTWTHGKFEGEKGLEGQIFYKKVWGLTGISRARKCGVAQAKNSSLYCR